MADKKNKNNAKDDKPIVVAKNAAELQKIRLEKLMSKPEKPVYIPERPKDYKPRDPLEFVRNVWGSSAGAGSGDFHVYRGVRRREYARQKFAKEKQDKDDAEEEYRRKIEENAKAAEERTAKKRAKRLKKKQKAKKAKTKKEVASDDESEPDDDDDDSDNVDNNESKDNNVKVEKDTEVENSDISNGKS